MVPRVTERGGGRTEPGIQSPQSKCRPVRSSGQCPASPLDRPRPGVSTGLQLSHLSSQAFWKDFTKGKASPHLHVPKLLSFHGDSRIANSSKSEPGVEGGGKLADPQRSRHGWCWLSSSAADSPSGAGWGNLRDARPQARGPGVRPVEGRALHPPCLVAKPR